MQTMRSAPSPAPALRRSGSTPRSSPPALTLADFVASSPPARHGSPHSLFNLSTAASKVPQQIRTHLGPDAPAHTAEHQQTALGGTPPSTHGQPDAPTPPRPPGRPPIFPQLQHHQAPSILTMPGSTQATPDYGPTGRPALPPAQPIIAATNADRLRPPPRPKHPSVWSLASAGDAWFNPMPGSTHTAAQHHAGATTTTPPAAPPSSPPGASPFAVNSLAAPRPPPPPSLSRKCRKVGSVGSVGR